MSSKQIKLYSTTTAGGGKEETTTIGYINPEATGAKMKEFAQRLNDFTTNVYEKTELVETTNLETETVKIIPTLTLGTPTVNNNVVTIPYETNNTTGIVFANTVAQFGDYVNYKTNRTIGRNSLSVTLPQSGNYTVYCGIDEATNYYSVATYASYNITI